MLSRDSRLLLPVEAVEERLGGDQITILSKVCDTWSAIPQGLFAMMLEENWGGPDFSIEYSNRLYELFSPNLITSTDPKLKAGFQATFDH